MRSYMKYNTVIYGFYRAKKGIDFGKSLFVLEGIRCEMLLFHLPDRCSPDGYAERTHKVHTAVPKSVV